MLSRRERLPGEEKFGLERPPRREDGSEESASWVRWNRCRRANCSSWSDACFESAGGVSRRISRSLMGVYGVPPLRSLDSWPVRLLDLSSLMPMSREDQLHQPHMSINGPVGASCGSVLMFGGSYALTLNGEVHIGQL